MKVKRILQATAKAGGIASVLLWALIGARVVYAAEWFNFRATGVIASQPPDGSARFGELAWSPIVAKGSSFLVRPEVGISLVPDLFEGSFLIADIKLNVGVRLFWPWLEIGPSLQSWFSTPHGTFIGLNSRLVFPVELSFVNEIFGGYTKVLSAGNGVSEYCLGFGVRL